MIFLNVYKTTTIILNLFQNFHFLRMSNANSSNQKDNKFSCVSGIICYIYISFIHLFQMCIESGTSRLITVGWNYFWQESEVEVFKLQESGSTQVDYASIYVSTFWRKQSKAQKYMVSMKWLLYLPPQIYRSS